VERVGVVGTNGLAALRSDVVLEILECVVADAIWISDVSEATYSTQRVAIFDKKSARPKDFQDCGAGGGRPGRAGRCPDGMSKEL
jgi:hypothetical protein